MSSTRTTCGGTFWSSCSEKAELVRGASGHGKSNKEMEGRAAGRRDPLRLSGRGIFGIGTALSFVSSRQASSRTITHRNH